MGSLRRLTGFLSIVAVLFLGMAPATVSVGIPSAWAQEGADAGVVVPLPLPNPLRVPEEEVAPAPDPALAGPLNFLPVPGEAPAPLDFLPIPVPTQPDGTPLPPQQFTLTGLLTEGGQPIPDGINWRVFGAQPGPDGQLPLVAEADGGVARLTLEPGQYLLHAAYGRAGATTRILVGPDDHDQTVVLNAGGLRLTALVGDDVPIPPADLRFEVYVISPDGGRALVVDDARSNDIVRLNAGAYHVVSYYGETNAVVRADIRIDAGQLTDVTLYHQAARVTLKLVTSRGGEALANTAWSVVSAGGEIVFDSIGAFPSVVLATGDYTAIARHDDLIYESAFTIVSALNRDVEVLADNPVPAATP